MNQINDCLKSDQVNFIALKEITHQLNIKFHQLKEIIDKTESLLKLENYDKEVASVH